MSSTPSGGVGPAAHEHRQMAESFGVDPERYDRHRPPYPQALVDRVVAGSPGLDVLDVGCGTGIEARQLVAAGCRVLGVEADPRMAEFARHTGLAVEDGRFETWDAEGRSFDAVVAGTAWHWVDPDAGAVKALEVLGPGGLLAPFWHVFEMPDDLLTAFAEAFARAVPDSPVALGSRRQGMAVYQAGLDRAAEGMRRAGGFTEPEQWQVEWRREYGRQEWLDQLATTGGLTAARPDQREEVLDAVGAAIEQRGGSFTMRYTSVVVSAHRDG